MMERAVASNAGAVIAQIQGVLGALTVLASSMNLTNQMRHQGLDGGGTQNMLNIIT